MEVEMIKLKRLRCSFCGKDENHVLKLVAGRRGYICDRCAAIANEIMTGPKGPQTSEMAPHPTSVSPTGKEY
jgi:ATP-dependent protease Clp ATPase subunit